MKLSLAHEIRIEAFDGLIDALGDHMGVDAAIGLVKNAKNLALQIIDAAEDDADGGRLTSAIDSIRAALEAFNAAIDIKVAKKLKIEREEKAAKAAEPS